jgi:biotin carboxylase
VVEGGAPGAGRRLLVLGAGPAQLGLLRAARARDLFVIAADRDAGAVGFPLADRRAVISAEDEQAIARLAEAEHVDGLITPGTDWPVAIAARVAERLGLSHPISPDTAAAATNKLRQRELLAQAGVPQPRWTVGRSPEEEPAIEPPCVVKPPDRQGQRGLSVVRDAEELADAVERADAESRTGGWLVEELIDGPEITVNGYSVGGRFHTLTVTDRLVAEPPAFGVALAHAWPTDHDPGTIAADAARALGIEDGPTYTQIRFGADGPKIIEVAARLGGGHDAELCEAAIGVDLNGAAIAAALGDPVDEEALVPRPRAGGACTRFLVAPRGVLEAIDGFDEAQAAPGVLDVRFYRPPGHRFGLLRTGPDRAGAIIATGATRDGALANADEAAARIVFRVA